MKNQPADALAMLKADHTKVKDLFAQFDGLGARAHVSKKRIADQICQELTIHTQLEEEIFYPAVRDAINDQDLMDVALVEHAGAKELVAQISAMEPGDALYDARVKVLCDQILHHVEEEEGTIFPQAQDAGLDMAALGEEMADLKATLTEEVSQEE